MLPSGSDLGPIDTDSLSRSLRNQNTKTDAQRGHAGPALCNTLQVAESPHRSQTSIHSLSTAPTRIAFCVTDLDPGGAERCLVQLATGLERNEWEPCVYCLGPPGELVEALERAVVYLGMWRGLAARDGG